MKTKFTVLDFIPFGKENAISQEDLAIRMQCDKRTIRATIYSARVKGAVICSTCEGGSTAGYYRPLSVNEAMPYIKMQRSRIASAKEALKSAEEYISEYESEDIACR